MKVLAQKYMEKDHKRDRKNWLKNFSKILCKTGQENPFYRVQKTSRWAQFSGQTELLVDRPTCWPKSPSL